MRISRWNLGFGVLAVVLFGAGYGLRATRRITRVVLGEKIAGRLAAHDAEGLVDLMRPSDLAATDLDRAKAIALVQKFTMPVADDFTRNLKRVSVAGNFAAFEKNEGDEFFAHPLVIELPRDGDEYVVDLHKILSASWNVKRERLFAEGKGQKDYVDWLTGQFAEARAMGHTKSFDWAHHEVHEIPVIPFTSPLRR